MKTNIVMRVTPEQSRKVQEIAIARGANWYGRSGIEYTKFEQLFINFDKSLEANKIYLDPYGEYEEVDADLFIRTNGTCEERQPEQGEEIMVWNTDETKAVKREFISMTKDGKQFICHSRDGDNVRSWPNAKPAPKEWYETVSSENPVLCWVEGKNTAKWIDYWAKGHVSKSGKKQPFKSGYLWYCEATPVTCYDLKNN
ncbi:MAG: hypothetical protein PVF17_00145 [Ignavibacteria bacterium]|jgi:hypothetical protein